jgi:tRNA(Ile)-lysidine synthase
MLAVSRAEVLEHLGARALPWREDPTNADPSFLRNRIRSELLPYLESRLNPSARETLARAATLLAEEDDLIAELADALWARVALRDGPAVRLDRKALRGAPAPLGRRALRRALEETGGLRGVGHGHVEKLLSLAGGASGRRLPLPGGREAFVRFGEIRIGPRVAAAGPFAFELSVPGRVELPGGQAVLARPARGPASAGERSAVVAAPSGPLVVRSRRAGDRVRAGRRDMSLKRFLIDRRVPADLRPRLPLVAAGNLVVWVPGQAVPAAEAASEAGSGFVRLELQVTS